MKNKIINLISNIISKRHGNIAENFTIFVSNAGKTGNVPEFKFNKFKKNIYLRWYKCNNYIVTTSALDFKQFYII